MGKGSGKENAEKTRSEEEREAQTQRASKEIEKGRRRKKDKARGTEAKREPHRGKWERDTGTEGRTRPRESVPEQEGFLPAPKCGGRERPPAAPQLELANWTPGKRQESLHLEALRVPPRGCGEGVRHEPRLKKESGRILQRLSWQWAGKLHRLASLVWDFSVGREDRGPAPSIPSVLGSAGGLGGSGCQREGRPTSLWKENRPRVEGGGWEHLA